VRGRKREISYTVGMLAVLPERSVCLGYNIPLQLLLWEYGVAPHPLQELKYFKYPS
jgi:hypothetical protein